MSLRSAGGRSSGRLRLDARLAIARFRASVARLRPGGEDRRRQRDFDAFISYSHDRDGRIAVALQHALHRFARPWYRLRALHVFRDDANLTANPNLWSSITAGLRTARFLVLLASPDAAASPWVNREVAHWLEHRSADRILIVLTDGELSWDDRRGDFDLERSDALPPALSGAFEGEPRFVDMRFARELEPLSTRNPEFRNAAADLAAAIHERPKEELIGEDVRQYRRTRRIAWGAGLTVLALAIAATVAAILAVRERDRAEEQLRLAVSRFLAQEATGGLGKQHSQSILLALEALELRETPEARSLLYRALVSRPEILRFMQSEAGAPADVAFSPDGESLAVLTERGIVEFLDPETGRRTGTPVEVGGSTIPVAAVSPGDGALAVGSEAGSVHVFDAAGEARSELRPRGDYGVPAAITFAGEDRVVAGYTENVAVVWDLDSGATVDELAARGPGAVDGLSYTSRGKRLAVSSGYSTIDVWELEGPTSDVATLELGRSVSEAVAFSPEGDRLAIGTLNGDLHLVDARDWTRLPAPESLPDPVTDLAFSPDGETLGIATIGTEVRLWNTRRSEWEGNRLAGHIGSVSGLAFSPDGTELATAGRDGNLILWDPARSDRLSEILPSSADADRTAIEIDEMAVDPERGRVAWTLLGGGLRLGELDGGEPLELLPSSSANGTITSLEFSPDGRLLAAAIQSGFQADYSLRLWDAQTGRPVESPLRARAQSVSFSPDGKTLVAGMDNGLELLETASGEREVLSLKGLQGRQARFSPDGRTIAAPVGLEGDVALLSAGSGERIGTLATGELEYVRGVEFSPDGQILAGGDVGGNVVLWDLATERPLGPPFTTGRESTAEHLAFSPDGNLLAASDSFARLHLWDVDLRRSLGPTLTGTAPAFGNGGELLAAIWPDRGIVLRDLDLDSWRETACSLANRNLGDEEWDRFLGGVRDYEPTCPGLPRGRPAEPEFAIPGE